MQIKHKLALRFFAISASIICMALIYIFIQFKTQLTEEFYDNLKSKAVMLANMVATKIDSYAELQQQSHSDITKQSHEKYTDNISIFDLNGKLLYSFNPQGSVIQTKQFDDIKRLGELNFTLSDYKGYGMIYRSENVEPLIVVSEAYFSPSHLESLKNILIVVFLISITLIAFAGWLFAIQALSPLNKIMNQVDSILPNDLSQRLHVTSQKDELFRLVSTFNKLLERIQTAFNTQRLFLSHVAHELKNPLNIIIAQIEVALSKDREKSDLIKVLNSVLNETHELNSVEEKLMQLARLSSNGNDLQFNSYRIDEMIYQTQTSLSKINPTYKSVLKIESLPDEEELLFIECNEQLFRLAMVNLMENGCKYSPDKIVHINLFVKNSNDIFIEFKNNGNGISNAELPHIFTPYYRGSNASNVKGAGIGLALVDSILRLHDFELNVFVSSENHTSFEIKIPSKQN